MAWKELLQLHDTKPEVQAQFGDGEEKDWGSLIRRVCEQFGKTVAENAAEDDDLQGPVRCADGYIRRSPVQHYRTAEDFMRRRIRKIIMIVIGAVFAVLLIYALMRSGLLVFRLR